MNAQLKQKIAEIAEQCAAPGWDGYGANAVTPEAVARARTFADWTLRLVNLITRIAESSGQGFVAGHCLG